ncbi:MAG: N-6 DNA methylase, partial [Gaiellales bacterium]
MAEAKASRDRRRQLGQWMTPAALAQQIVARVDLAPGARVLEPCFGDGAFLLPLIERLVALRGGDDGAYRTAMRQDVFGVELDPGLYARALERIAERFGPLPGDHQLRCGDFFATDFAPGQFAHVVGNPPYGGTFDPGLEDALDRRHGRWDGHKLKKETYAFFIARCLDWLSDDGTLDVITSDTFLTIATMGGLRRRLLDQTSVELETIRLFSDETAQPMLVLRAMKGTGSDRVLIDDVAIDRLAIESTRNGSWRVDASLARYFGGPTLGDLVVASSGMTIGDNALFLREITDGRIRETHRYEFFDDPVTLANELARARLRRLSERRQGTIRAQEAGGCTLRNVRVTPLPVAREVSLPDPDYRYYNKADASIVYAPPRFAIFWRDDGDAVVTFKRNGNWYLRGVGGRPFFEREGLSWQLVSQRLNMRYLPAGSILDSGARWALVRSGIDPDELWFVLGWCLTREATRIVKTVLNHTRNIQSKDVERLPYPHWVPVEQKAA